MFARFQFLIAGADAGENANILRKGDCTFLYSFREYSYNQYISQLMHLIEFNS